MSEDKTQKKHYIGLLEEIDTDSDAFKFNFLRRVKATFTFIFPAVLDTAWSFRDDVLREVQGLQCGSTSRQNRKISFDALELSDFSNLY